MQTRKKNNWVSKCKLNNGNDKIMIGWKDIKVDSIQVKMTNTNWVGIEMSYWNGWNRIVDIGRRV